MVAVHISKHSLFRLKITVDCRLCTCPSIHFSLDEDTLKITVGCLVCGVVCVCACGVCGVWVVCTCGVVCGVGEAWHTLSLALSPSSSLSLSFSLLSLFLSLLFIFIFLLLLFLLLLLLLFFLFFVSLLFSPPNTMERTDQPTRRPTSRHLNVIWRRASAQQSVLSLLLSPHSSLLLLPSSKKKEETFYYRNISGEGVVLHYSFILIQTNRRRVKLQSLQFFILIRKQ